MLASQLQRSLLEAAGGGPGAWDRAVSTAGTGALLVERVYRPGKSVDWRELIRGATGSPLQADAFVTELSAE